MEGNPLIEIVVASYAEELGFWKQEFPGAKVTIYNAAGRDGLIPVPNIGREAGQWARHLATWYNDLADVTCFVQGVPHEQPAFLAELAGGEFPHGFCYFGAEPGPDVPISPAKRHLLAPLWREPSKVPPSSPSRAGAQFYVRREIVHRMPASHYVRLLTIIENDPGRMPYALEHNWGSVFLRDPQKK